PGPDRPRRVRPTPASTGRRPPTTRPRGSRPRRPAPRPERPRPRPRRPPRRRPGTTPRSADGPPPRRRPRPHVPPPPDRTDLQAGPGGHSPGHQGRDRNQGSDPEHLYQHRRPVPRPDAEPQ